MKTVSMKPVVQNPRKDGFWAVYIRFTFDGQCQFWKTSKVVSSQNVKSKSEITDSYVLSFCSSLILQWMEKLNHVDYSAWSLKDVVEYVTNDDYVDRLNKVDTSLWTVQEVVRFLKQGTSDVCFSDYARQYQAKMIREGHARNARTYELAYQHLERFAGTNKMMFSHLTSSFINSWISSLSNTARAKEQYPVCVRQIFKQALIDFNDYDFGLIRITTNPWPKVKIPKSDTPQKRAITMEECRAFFTAPLPESDRKYPLSELGRDVAMMILCLAGINTVDIFFLEKKNYSNGIICYERRKTRAARTDNAYFEIRVPGILQPIIDKYLDDSDSIYLFNFHKRLSSYDSFNANVNIGIRQICEKVLEIEHGKGYSAYTFRHTWATVAQNECGATLSEVDFGLNHSHHTKLARTYVKIDFTPAWVLNDTLTVSITSSSVWRHYRKYALGIAVR